MPGTTCKEAIKNWEAQTGQTAAEATHVKLICQLPPIERMDDSLSQLENCVQLSLSTNAIDRMIALPKLKNLKILSLSRNNIKRIMSLEDIGQNLEELWLSYNQVEKLDGLSNCIKLHTLFISNNKIKAWDEVTKLSQLPELKTLLLVGNPIYGGGEKTREENWPSVYKRVGNLESLDGKMITADVKKLAPDAD